MNIKRKLILSLSALAALVLSSVMPSQAQDEQFMKSMDAYIQNDDNLEKLGNALNRHFIKKRQEQETKGEAERMEKQFANPVKIDIGSSPVKGPENAKITIVEFSEFQCPYCRMGAANVAEVLKQYPEQVKLVFKNFPLPFHAQAPAAAAAAIAAKNQGKFWEMHDKLFANQQQLGDNKYEEWAKELGLDVEKFKADMNSEETKKIIEEEKAQGTAAGVNGTPGYFINGVALTGAQPPQAFKPIIERWLKQ